MARFLNMEALKSGLTTRIQNPDSQRTMVLCVVCVALLLDNMLYMVIVPIVPDYLQTISALGNEQVVWTNGTYVREMSLKNANFNETTGQYELRWLVTESGAKIGTLFAFKAIIQLAFNPIAGTIIDRIGYDLPMMFGLCVIFVSTSMFAFGYSFGMMFLARGLQGMGSAFADTAGLAMIADRYTGEAERTKALGIALAFISFGSLVAPPFGGILYQFCGKELPFISLAFIALFDGFFLIFIMQPVRIERTVLKAEGNLPKGTPFHRLLVDPYIAICAGCLAIANVSLAFLEPTIATWMSESMHATNAQEGLVWLPAFLPHLAGVITTIKLASAYPKFQWLMAAVGLAIEGVSCFFIPFCSNFITLMIPISVLCYGIALVDTAILPTMAFLVDTRHVSVYGSVYAIADLSYSLAYAIGPIIAGALVHSIKFMGLNIVITLSTLAYVPVLYLLRNCYDNKEITAASRELRRRSTFSASERKRAEKLMNDDLLLDGEDRTVYPGYEQSQTMSNTVHKTQQSSKPSGTGSDTQEHRDHENATNKREIPHYDRHGYG